MEVECEKELFASIVATINAYTGTDPLRPWLQGIRRLRKSIPPHLLNQKLPRFLQKCVQTFQSDRRYRDDLRYLQVWIQLMDFVDNPGELLHLLEKKKIGAKHALYYQAFALYYERLNRFAEAEKIYQLGLRGSRVASSAMKHLSSSRGMSLVENDTQQPIEVTCRTSGNEEAVNSYICSDTTIIVSKFVDSAIVGKSEEVEDAFHHGLVDPTINLKEAMDDINSMFQKPLDVQIKNRKRTHHTPSKSRNKVTTGFEVFVDDGFQRDCPIENERKECSNIGSLASQCSDVTVVVRKFADSVIVDESNDAEGARHHGLVEPTICTKEALSEINQMFGEPLDFENPKSKKERTRTEAGKPSVGSLTIFVDNCDVGHKPIGKFNAQEFLREEGPVGKVPSVHPTKDSKVPIPLAIYNERENSPPPEYGENTVACKFIGSTILGDSEIENVCHHGLVDPTVNLKEAIKDINSMFGRPIDFTKSKKNHRPSRSVPKEQPNCEFSILADEDLEPQNASSSERSGAQCDLFEPTVFTKEALAEINNMFVKPMDF
ncbi:hypothetical protein AMTRI_Chr08g208200 [Amborella trichopoda]